jgi:hypothetical protein
MIDLILPKCNLVFGKDFSSVYLQILLYLNRNPNTKGWKKEKCWLSTETISKNINGNVRTVNSVLEHMQKINLIQKSYHGKLYMFSLKNHKINNFNDIKTFNFNIQQNLFNYMEKNKLKQNKIDDILNKFNNINKVSLDSSNYEYQFKDLNLLRKWIILSEKIQHGSSLLFMMFFANNIINLNEIKIENLSEQQRAIKLGCSQSTISRYLNSFKKIDCIDIISKSDNLPNEIILNEELLQMSEINLNIEKEIFKCPVCGKEIESEKKLNSHISRCKDQLHSMFKEMQKENNAITYEEIQKVYDENKQKFDDIVNEKDNEKKRLNSLCNQLVRYYYSITNTKCPSWCKEMNLIKSHLNNGLQPDEIMEVMRYMAKKGNEDLRFFNNYINEAFIIRQCKLDFKKEGTDAYLIGFYYKNMNQKITDRLMLQGIKKINELKSNNYDYVQIKTIIEYMVEKKCPNFNFIVNMANEALTKSQDKSKMTKTYTSIELVKTILDGVLEYGNVMLADSNFDMAKKDIILKLKEDICNGKVELTRVNKTYYKFAIALANEVCNRQIFNKNFTLQQWVDKVQLNKVNLELINY